ncbi:MAG: fibronectin type III domain-containing protein, partial [Bacteroidetes bacterium]|nr:fibronectin type III domain-containing protein [Bacteroidota bacterium]
MKTSPRYRYLSWLVALLFFTVIPLHSTWAQVFSSPMMDQNFASSESSEQVQQIQQNLQVGSDGFASDLFYQEQSDLLAVQSDADLVNTITLNQPQDGATNVTITPTFQWSADPTAVGYEIALSAFGVVLQTLQIETNSISFIGSEYSLNYETTYSWKVRGYYLTSGPTPTPGPWSASSSFTTMADPTDPGDGDPESPLISFDTNLEPTELDGQEVYILKPTVADEDTLLVSLSYVPPLDDPDAVFTLQYSINNPVGGQIYDDSNPIVLTESAVIFASLGAEGYLPTYTSKEFAIVTATPAPEPIILLEPAEGDTVSKNPTLTWEDDANAEQYKLEVTPAGGEASTITKTGTSHTLSNLEPDTEYSWRVRGSNSFEEGEWSETRTFITEQDPPEQVTLLTPQDGLQDVPVSPTPSFTWTEDENATSYHFELSQGGTIVAEDEEVSGTSYSLPSGTTLSYATPYSWRVRGINAVAQGPWSTSFSFTTQEPPLENAPGIVFKVEDIDGTEQSEEEQGGYLIDPKGEFDDVPNSLFVTIAIAENEESEGVTITYGFSEDSIDLPYSDSTRISLFESTTLWAKTSKGGYEDTITSKNFDVIYPHEWPSDRFVVVWQGGGILPAYGDGAG